MKTLRNQVAVNKLVVTSRGSRFSQRSDVGDRGTDWATRVDSGHVVSGSLSVTI
jgi:hypothetical protein